MPHYFDSIVVRLTLLLGCCWLVSAQATDSVLPISAFSKHSTHPWAQHSFGKGTDYRLAQVEPDGSGPWVLAAVSEGAASAFYRKLKIDLQKTPILTWRWRVEQPLRGLEERSKSGDDYAARVYVVHKRGFFDKGLAVNYVWSGNNTKGSIWPNAYAMKSSQMLALQDANTPLAQWQTERRNVRDDFKQLLGEDIHSVEVVVLMSDTDNSGKTARAFYGDLVFSAD